MLSKLLNNNLFIKAEKYFFLRKSINYLRMVISKGQVNMDKKKVLGVLEWPVPTKVKHMQAFLDFANFYHIFIKAFAKIVTPLMILTRKDVSWEWGPEQVAAFEALKQAFMTAPILRIPV